MSYILPGNLDSELQDGFKHCYLCVCVCVCVWVGGGGGGGGGGGDCC